MATYDLFLESLVSISSENQEIISLIKSKQFKHYFLSSVLKALIEPKTGIDIVLKIPTEMINSVITQLTLTGGEKDAINKKIVVQMKSVVENVQKNPNMLDLVKTYNSNLKEYIKELTTSALQVNANVTEQISDLTKVVNELIETTAALPKEVEEASAQKTAISEKSK